MAGKTGSTTGAKKNKMAAAAAVMEEEGRAGGEFDDGPDAAAKRLNIPTLEWLLGEWLAESRWAHVTF